MTLFFNKNKLVEKQYLTFQVNSRVSEVLKNNVNGFVAININKIKISFFGMAQITESYL